MKVLVTAGTVYGKLDDNKLVGNRIRGIWAVKYALGELYGMRGWNVTLLLPDTFDRRLLEGELITASPALRALIDKGGVYDGGEHPRLEIRYHDGYYSYAEQCYELAPKVDAAVMAAAVVNWIPKEAFKGKMPTAGFREGAEQLIPFILAPRVIDRMRKLNPKLTLIGCKMTSGATGEETYDAAYQTLEKAKAHVVVSNDLTNLKQKTLVYPDGSAFQYRLDTAVGEGGVLDFYGAMSHVMMDRHYRTEADPNPQEVPYSVMRPALERMERIIEKYRKRFSHPIGKSSRVFGAIAVRVGESGFLVSPREKGSMFTANECIRVTKVDHDAGVIYAVRGNKGALNTPLLIRMLQQYRDLGDAVLHLHEFLLSTNMTVEKWGPSATPSPNMAPTVVYAPPSTVRDNQRDLPRHAFNIDRHGFVAMLNGKDEIF